MTLYKSGMVFLIWYRINRLEHVTFFCHLGRRERSLKISHPLAADSKRYLGYMIELNALKPLFTACTPCRTQAAPPRRRRVLDRTISCAVSIGIKLKLVLHESIKTVAIKHGDGFLLPGDFFQQLCETCESTLRSCAFIRLPSAGERS
jgi:hypothetical protein